MSRDAERRQELLAERALAGLSEAEARELEALGGAGDDSFDLAAAGATLASLGRAGPLDPLPPGLAARVLASAPTARAPGRAAAPPRPPRARWSPGWLVAAAAMVLAAAGWLRPLVPAERAGAARARTTAEARQALLAEARDARIVAWSASSDPSARGATGDVVWSASRRQGYMRIRGLAANDPSALQYQLWIFDASRDERYPVDGGVFDVVEGEVVIPIHAAIDVREAKLFAVTVERPGGVVVSQRERIVLTAAL